MLEEVENLPSIEDIRNEGEKDLRIIPTHLSSNLKIIFSSTVGLDHG